MPKDQRLAPNFMYGTAWKEDRTAALTELAIRAGFRAIDTANQRKHYFEAGVGEALVSVYAANIVSRKDLFLQTKFTYQRGQDHRLPYDPNANLSSQVGQSMASSLEHLGTDHVDSYVLHGPSGYAWNDDDSEVWQAMCKERDAGHARLLGVSNVSLQHLVAMSDLGLEAPSFVQDRCFARTGWDREVRAFCSDHNAIYQGFSLLTANVDTLRHPLISALADRKEASVAQIIFCFARQIGMLPLTGTSKVEHMEQDLASREIELSAEEVLAIENLAEA